MSSINSINGMSHQEATSLRRARVRTTSTFLQIAASRSGRALLSKETGISSPKLLHWAKRAELMKVNNKTHIVSRLPSEKRVNGWIEEARTLSTIVTS